MTTLEVTVGSVWCFDGTFVKETYVVTRILPDAVWGLSLDGGQEALMCYSVTDIARLSTSRYKHKWKRVVEPRRRSFFEETRDQGRLP